MSNWSGNSRSPSSPAHDSFQLVFEAADTLSLYWQPLLKSIGRWQLEMAQAGAKQSRAAIALNHRLTQATNPIDVINAQVQFWMQVGQAYSDANQHITQALARAAEPPAGVETLPVQKKRKHDTLRLDDRARHHGFEPERKVA
jgi:hypothetical protein